VPSSVRPVPQSSTQAGTRPDSKQTWQAAASAADRKHGGCQVVRSAAPRRSPAGRACRSSGCWRVAREAGVELLGRSPAAGAVGLPLAVRAAIAFVDIPPFARGHNVVPVRAHHGRATGDVTGIFPAPRRGVVRHRATPGATERAAVAAPWRLSNVILSGVRPDLGRDVRNPDIKYPNLAASAACALAGVLLRRPACPSPATARVAPIVIPLRATALRLERSSGHQSRWRWICVACDRGTIQSSLPSRCK